jgi:hypothetical protein
MALIDLSGLESVRELTQEVRASRIALESIARSLLSLTEIPSAPPAPPPLGPEAVSNYAQALMELEGEDADEIRAKLHAAGLSDTAIESQIVSMFAGNRDREGTLDD